MCSKRGISGIVVMCGIVFYGAAVVGAQDLQVSPMSWDFGNVAVGNSETITFDLLAGPPTPVWVYVISLHETPTNDPPFANPNDPLSPPGRWDHSRSIPRPGRPCPWNTRPATTSCST